MIAGLLCSALVVANASLMVTVPALQVGAWADSEPTVVALHAAGAIAWVGLALGVRQDQRVRAAVTHPFVLLPLALAGWSLFCAVFAEFPGLALLGSPQTGQGVLWYLDQAALTGAFLVVREHRTLRRVAMGSLMVAAGAGALVNLRHFPLLQPIMARLGVDPGWSLFAFNDYLVYYAVPLVVIGLAGLRVERGLSLASLAVGLGTLLAADNRSAQVGAVLVVVPTVAVWLWARGRRAGLLQRPTIIVLMAISVGLVSLLSYPVIRQVSQGAGVDTLWSRAVLGRAVEPALVSPKALLVGNGWGHYQQEMVRNIGTVGIRLYRSEWFDLSRDEFHTHNAALEAWFSAGIPGALLIVAMSLAMVLFAAPERRVLAWGAALHLSLMDALWFQMPTTVGALAMGAAALAGGKAAPAMGRRWVSAATLGGILVAVAGLSGSALALRHAMAVETWKRCLTEPSPSAECLDVHLPADPRQTNLGAAVILNDVVPAATAAANAGSLPPQRAAMIHQAIAEAADRAVISALSLSLAVNNAYGQWVGFPAQSPLWLGPSDAARWGGVIDHLQRVSPGRVDLVVPYVSWLLVAGREDTADYVVAQSERGAPDHPVSLWFRGILTLGKSDEQSRVRGLEQLRAALRGGVERFMPVPAEVKAALGEGGG